MSSSNAAHSFPCTTAISLEKQIHPSASLCHDGQTEIKPKKKEKQKQIVITVNQNNRTKMPILNEEEAKPQIQPV